MEPFLFKLLLCGIFLSIVGWFLDKAHRFTWLMKLVSRDAVNGLIALNARAQNPNTTVLPEHPGFNVILNHWPNLTDRDSVKLIGRGPAYTCYGAQVTTGFALVAKDENRNLIVPVWEEPSARTLFHKKLDLIIFRLGAIIFYLGIGAALISGILGFLKK